jgi:hypothetical protein
MTMPPRYLDGNGLEYLGNRAKGRHQGSLRSKFKRASWDESYLHDLPLRFRRINLAPTARKEWTFARHSSAAMCRSPEIEYFVVHLSYQEI